MHTDSQQLEIKINNSLEPDARYISFAPSPCQIRQTSTGSAVQVKLSSKAAIAGGGVAQFYASRALGAEPTSTLTLTLPGDGSPVDFGLAGKTPSIDDLDCLLIASCGNAELEIPLMVRVRKNANTLEDRERDRFLLALAKLNRTTPAPSKYQTLRNMHVDSATGEEHGGPQFLPWHRTYLLDLERSLQAIDPAVSMHYWRFDETASNLFTTKFIGRTKRSSSADLVTLDSANPLVGWVTDSDQGILRTSRFNTQTEPAPGLPLQNFPLRDQAQTLALGAEYPQFSTMEGSPHGAAHVSFNGWLSVISTAPKDPLFFLLHSNVDRLWALWQWVNRRTDPDDLKTYTGQNRDGRRVNDTTWPWNGVTTPPRPNFAPGSGLPSSPLTPTPGSTPTIRNMIDYDGSRVSLPLDWLGFSYDDVPFEFTP